MKPKVLSTKKLDPDVVGHAGLTGIVLEEKEMISVVPLLSEEKKAEVRAWIGAGQQYAVFTSANAVLPFRQYIQASTTPGWKLFCFSGKTREALEALLPGEILATAESAAGLAPKIMEAGVKELLFFCGNQRREELPQQLSAAGIVVHEVVVYETTATPHQVDADFDAVLFFSPSGVESFFAVNRLKEEAVCFTIGHTTAAAVKSCTGQPVIVSTAPTQEAILAAVKQYFQHRPGPAGIK